MSKPIIEISGLSKSYRLGAIGVTSLRDDVDRFWRRLRGAAEVSERKEFWALKDVSFEVQPGEVVGIIGRNGAGKSTLLKILSRITEPTRGEIRVRGRIASLLEVGTGFHPDLTGRENIFLNGAILGMSRAEVRSKFQEIVDFSGVEKFLDTPVKRYSSGMYVRLAFAVAAHLDPEVLIVDEVLAVGDAEFQRKCLGKMGDVARTGRTILFVSHNMFAIEALCKRAILLEAGRIKLDSDPKNTTSQFLLSLCPTSITDSSGVFDLSKRANEATSRTPVIHSIAFMNSEGKQTTTIRMGEPIRISIDLHGLRDFPDALVGILIKSDADQRLAGFSTAMNPPKYPVYRALSETLVLSIPRLPLVPNRYWLDVAVKTKIAGTLDWVERAASFTILDADVYGTGTAPAGLLFLEGSWKCA